jgi:hypothetical protein
MRTHLQFGLWQLVAIVILCTIPLAILRHVGRGGIAGAPPIVWVCIGIAIGHGTAVLLLDLIDRDARASRWQHAVVAGKAVMAWLGCVAATSLALWWITSDYQFAKETTLWLGSGFFVCALVCYELWRPYRPR